LVDIEQSSSTAGDSAAVSFSADKQESLNRATDEVFIVLLLFCSLRGLYQYNT